MANINLPEHQNLVVVAAIDFQEIRSDLDLDLDDLTWDSGYEKKTYENVNYIYFLFLLDFLDFIPTLVKL